MKILHLCLSCFYIEGYSYQENLLPKYHKKFDNEVKILASCINYNEKGEQFIDYTNLNYTNDSGIEVTRLKYKYGKIGKILRLYSGTYAYLINYKPDFIFIHGIQFADINSVVKYVHQYPNTRIVIDNHSDFSNSAKSWMSKNVQHKVVWKHYAKKILPYVHQFYGVLPARVDFLHDMYNIPQDRIKLLVMGADDDKVEKAKINRDKSGIRERYNIPKDAFLVVTGGKIDKWKLQTILLMKAVNSLAEENVFLIVFGSVTDEIKSKVLSNESENVKYIGWISSDDTYDYFEAADLVCFPGRHSVLWEQAAAQAKPLIVKYWDGTTHIGSGKNIIYLKKDSEQEIKIAIKRAKDDIGDMQSEARNVSNKFLYSKIAERALD